MVKDLPKEPAKTRAARRWGNNALTERFKKMKATGEGSEEFSIRDGKKYFATEVPKPPKEPLKPADVVENEGPKAHRFERKLLKDIRAMMEGHKQRNVELFLAIDQQQRRRLLKEKLRRLEVSIAARQGE